MTLELVTPGWTKTRQDQIGECRDQLDKCCFNLLGLLPEEDREHSSDLITGFCAILRVINALSKDIGS